MLTNKSQTTATLSSATDKHL